MSTKVEIFWCIVPSCIRFRAVSEVFSRYEWSCELSGKVVFDVLWHSFFIYSPPLHTLYKHIVAVKTTINKQSPHGNCCLSRGRAIFETSSAGLCLLLF